MQRLMEGNSPVLAFFDRDPFAGGPPPTLMRATLYALVPVTPAEHHRTGRWWTRHRIGLHLPEAHSDPAMFAEFPAPPELFHWDDVVWRRHVSWFKTYEDEARAAPDLAALESAARRALRLGPESMERFWQAFIPAVKPAQVGSWCDLPDVVRMVGTRFVHEELRDFERIAMLLALGLAARLEDRVFGEPSRALPVPSYLHVGMLAHRLLLDGRATFGRALLDADLVEHAAVNLQVAEGARLWGVFRYETFAYHARFYRRAEQIAVLEWQAPAPGFGLLRPFLSGELVENDPWSTAVTRAIADGSWHIDFLEDPAP